MRERNGLRAAVDSELADHALDVRRDRLGADEEAARDAFLRDPGREQAQNLTLTPRQVIPHARRPARGPGREPPDAREQLVGVERLDDVVVRPEQDPSRAVVLIIPRPPKYHLLPFPTHQTSQAI